MSYEQIAAETGIGYYTVRRWCRAYREGGWAALCPKQAHRPARGKLSSFDPLVQYVVLRLKREHPKWGADLIRLKLTHRASLKGKRLPSRSALADYLKPYLPRITKRYRAVCRRATSPVIQITQAHECWQMDFKGAEPLGACGSSAPFMIADGATSAALYTRLYPGTLKGVTWRTVQQDLREAFTTWGLPDYLRMDRASIFVGSTRLEWPSELHLWLVGLGVTPIINRAHRPTDNARVERQNGTWKNHVAVGAQFATLSEAQAATDEARADRLLWLPSRNKICQGKAPLIACPKLIIPRRAYHPAQERHLFDFERVALYLSDWYWLRQVDQTGCISLANRNVSIGRDYSQQAVKIIFDLETQQFVAQAYDDTCTTLHCFSLPEVTADHIMGLAVGESCHTG
jgi:transposase InsO family protein